MKTRIFLLCILISAAASSQNTDSIPNSGFENWIWVSWFDNPTSWNTNNNQLMVNTVVEDSDSYSGDLAMMLTNQGALIPHAYCFFPIAHHPIALNGYLKNHLLNNDSAVFEVHLYHNNILVDSGYQVIYGGFNPNYSSFLIPVSQNSALADSCIISFYGGTVFQSQLSVDDLSFTFPSSIFENEPQQLFSAGPNPTNDLLYVEWDYNSCSDEATITLYNIEGKKMLKEKLRIPDKISMKELPAGVYFLTLQAGNKTGRKLIIKE